MICSLVARESNFNASIAREAIIAESVLKLAKGLRRGILAVAKAASGEHPRGGL
jgi:hypothetical protein